MAAGLSDAFEPFLKLASQAANVSASEQDDALASLSSQATSGELEEEAKLSGRAFTMNYDQWLGTTIAQWWKYRQ